VAGVVLLLRRFPGRRRGRGPWHGGPPWHGRGSGEAKESATDLLARRFAAGEIDEDEYWLRLSVLNESKGEPA
jgi:putative membrane protein